MFMITMQAQFGAYETKTTERESELGVSSLVTRAINTAHHIVYDDRFDGMDHGLLRALRLASNNGHEYVLTVHKVY